MLFIPFIYNKPINFIVIDTMLLSIKKKKKKKAFSIFFQNLISKNLDNI